MNARSSEDVIRHGENGFLFEGREELARLLVEVLGDAELCRSVSLKAFECRDQFRWDAVCRQYLELLQRPRTP